MKNLTKKIKTLDVKLPVNLVERRDFLQTAKGLGSPTIRILGVRIKDIMYNGVTKKNRLNQNDLGHFELKLYENCSEFRKFVKKYFKRVEYQLTHDNPEDWWKYHTGGIKSPIAVYKQLGGVVYYNIKKPFVKTLTMAIVNFFKALWNFFKALTRKIIFSMKRPKEVLC